MTTIVDIPADFDFGDLARSGQVGWRCRHCGKGRIFDGAVREEAAEAKAHEATCATDAPAFVSAKFRAESKEHRFPWCDTCGEPAVWRENAGWLRSTDAHRFGLPPHLDPSGHEVTAAQWAAS